MWASHLFWTCGIVNDFLLDVFGLVCNTGLDFTPTREQFLFGYLDKAFDEPKNYLVLTIKRFIWISKFNPGSLSIVRFKTHLKSVLSDLKVLYDLKNTLNKFNVWNDIFSILWPDSCDWHGDVQTPTPSHPEQDYPAVLHLLIQAAEAGDARAGLP